MPDSRPACDVLIVGGGPAAGTAARLLASWGRRVVVAAKPDAAAAPDLPVSLTPSCGKFFDLMGIRPAIDAQAFVRSTGHTVWWGNDARVEPFPDGALGWQASAGRLGEVLVEEAERAGAQVLRRALTLAEALAWPATFRLDCSGRPGVIARAVGHRRYEPAHRTVALIGVWSGTAAAGIDVTHTLLESYADGWAWSIPTETGERALAVMVDPRSTALIRGEGSRATYLSEVGKTRQLAVLVGKAELVGGPWGWDASMYSASEFTGDDWLLVGDAGSFVDPLSSAGVKKAMASAWLASVTVNTALGDPALATPALDLFARREAATYQQFLAMTRQYLAAGAGPDAGGHPFWAERGDESAAPGGVSRAEVESAFERLKDAAPLRLRRGPGVRVEARPALGERMMTLERHLVTADHPDGVRFVLDVDLVALVELAPEARDVPALHADYGVRAGEVAWPSFLTALATAIARRWLILE